MDNNQQSKRILIDLGHPAHVHLFRNAIKIWQEHGHSIKLTIRNKDVTAELLNLYGFSFDIASNPKRGRFGLFLELLEHDWNVYRLAKKQRSQLLLGTSVSITHVAPLISAKSIVFNEDDASIAKDFTSLAYPLANAIVTPDSLSDDFGKKHHKYSGYQKLAYLHPKYFKPNPKVKDSLGISSQDRFAIIRLVAFNAAHDKGEKGINFSLLNKLIESISVWGKLFISSETKLPEDLEQYQLPIPPTEIHSALYYANLFIGDSQSMTVEASILGTPAIRINSFGKRISVLNELENRYELCASFLPHQHREILAKVEEWVADKNIKDTWEIKKSKMLSEKCDVTQWIVDFVESFGEK